jgi:hypothetical protein
MQYATYQTIERTEHEEGCETPDEKPYNFEPFRVHRHERPIAEEETRSKLTTEGTLTDDEQDVRDGDRDYTDPKEH